MKTILAVLGLAFLVALTQKSQASCFTTPVVYPGAGGTDARIVSGDFNGDAILDLAVTGIDLKGKGFLYILLGNADGTFRSPVTYPSGLGTKGLDIGDFNGDGKLDVLVANFGDGQKGNGIGVFLGNGDGSFYKATSLLRDGPYLFRAVAADMNNDGKLDAVVSSYQEKFVGVSLGDGSGALQDPIPYKTGGFIPQIAVGDFNGDGFLDVVVANYSNSYFVGTVVMHLGNGDGSLRAGGSYSTNTYGVHSVAVADFNEDGRLDVATSNASLGDHFLSILLGNGDGSLQHAMLYPAGIAPWEIAGADFNRDGHKDVLSVDAYQNPGTMNLVLGNGDGSFQSPVQYSGLPPFVQDLTVGDFNGDGLPDAAMAFSQTEVAVVLNTGQCP